MKKHLPTLILSLVSTVVLAQQPAPKSVTVSIEGGKSFTSSALKQNEQLGDGYQMGGNVFVSLFRKGWDGVVKGGSKFNFGIIAGGDFTGNKTLLIDQVPVQSTYKLNTGNLNITNVHNRGNYSKGFSGFAGLQADISLGKIILSPSVSSGYFSLTQDGF